MARSKVFDAIVVGSGAAGGFAVKGLTEKGIRTLLLEAGPELCPARDFPSPGLEDYRDSVRQRVLAALGGQHIQARCTSFMRHLKHLYINDRQNPYTVPREKPFFWIRGRQVGGRLHTWAAMALRLSDYELLGATHDGYGEDWPLRYTDLAPYYDKVEEYLGLYGQADGLPQLPDGHYLGPRNLTPREVDFKVAVEKRWSDRRIIQARVIRHSPNRTPLPIVDARSTGNLELRPDAVVKRITIDPKTRKANGVEFVDRKTKQLQHVQGRLVVLCASALESVRILLNSACPQHPRGIGGSSGNLGRFIMDHCYVVTYGNLAENKFEPRPPLYDPYDFGAAQGFYIPKFRNVRRRHSGFIRGYGIQGAIGRGGAFWWLSAFGEMLPHEDNRIVVNPSKKDAWGIPVAHIICARSSNDRAMIKDAKQAMGEMAAAAGLDHVDGLGKTRFARILNGMVSVEPGVLYPGLAAHETGGARMGNDPERSVLDSFNRCWDAENVLVTDGASFVSSGYQGPTMTIMALTNRAIERVVADYENVAL